MECRCVDILTCFTQHGGKTIFQFPRRLVCKGDGENIIGAHRVLPQEGPKSLGRLAAAVQQAFQLRHLFRPGALRRICAAVRAAETNQIRNTVDKHRRFAAARPRQQEERSLGGQGRPALFRIQVLELPLDDGPSVVNTASRCTGFSFPNCASIYFLRSARNCVSNWDSIVFRLWSYSGAFYSCALSYLV